MVVTGTSAVVLPGDESADPTRFLKSPKSRKYMGLQDDLAVFATGCALEDAGLLGVRLEERAGLFIAVGYIPFNEADIAPVLKASVRDGRFAMDRFAGGGFQRAHPLLTFRCLPNMPAYHTSVNFDVRGPYFVTYPGAGQLYLALEEARAQLESGAVDVALVAAVAHQRNFLVEHHHARLDPPLAAEDLRDAGACIVCELEPRVRARGGEVRARLEAMSIDYDPGEPLAAGAPEEDSFFGEGHLGPASLLRAIHRGCKAGTEGTLSHSVRARDGIRAESSWDLRGVGEKTP